MSTSVQVRLTKIMEDIKHHVEAGDLTAAESAAEILKRLPKHCAWNLMQYAESSHRDKKPDAAIFYYRLAVRADPAMPHAHTNLGYLLEKRRQFDDAVRCYLAQLDATPDDLWANNNLGIIYCYRKKDHARGVPYLERAREIAPDNVQISHNLAWGYYCDKQYEKAYTAYVELIRRMDADPGGLLKWYSHTSEIYVDFALTCIKLGRPGAARCAAEMAIKLRPPERKEWDRKYREIYEYARSKGAAK